MEQSLHNRVYINPNFKRSKVDPWPKEIIATTHFNRHYVMETPEGIANRNKNEMPVHNRKIFVNPNFLNSSNVTNIPSKLPMSTEYIATNENFNNAPNMPLHKSKYCLVNNSQQIVKEPPKNVAETNKMSTQVSCPELCQDTKKQRQEVPLTRSRYCIVRKKKRLSVTLECKNTSLVTDLNVRNQPLTGASLNQFTCTSFNAVKNNEKVKLSCKTPEKITKIKMSKYKIMPVNFLKSNSGVKLNQYKFAASTLKPCFMSNSVVACSKNRFRFVKACTPMKSNSSVPATKAASRISLKVEKGVFASGIKSKLSKANFNINNIPCRLFTKYGKCLRRDRGHCKYLHDKKHVSLCSKFLKGICHDKNCSLSHELSDKKMPTCYFYLNGMCTKESCPYLHVKLNEKTKICQEFAKGYCESGDKCSFRHVIIKDLKKTRKRAANSPQCSQNKVTKTKEFKKVKELTALDVTNSEECSEKDAGDCRYYKELEKSDDSYEAIKPTRCKLGTLPSFIQL